MTTTVFGISNCDSVKKARRWLEDAGVDYRFHDFRRDGLDGNQVEAWVERLGWETLINRRSSSWKALPEETRKSMNADNAVECVLATPTLIKRPLLEHRDQLEVGFRTDRYDALFGA